MRKEVWATYTRVLLLEYAPFLFDLDMDNTLIVMFLNSLIILTGAIMNFIFNNSPAGWILLGLFGFTSVLGAINSILEPETLVNAAKYIATSSNMNSERKDDVQAVAITDTLGVMKSNMKKQTISILENTLKRLKSEA